MRDEFIRPNKSKHPLENPSVSPFPSHIPTISLSFPHSEQTPFSKPLFFLAYVMGDQSGPARFLPLFESALQAYEKKTGIALAEHPFAVQLQSCHSVESVIVVLKGQAKVFSEFTGSDRILKSIKSIVSISTTLSATALLGDALDLVRHKALVSYCAALTVFYSRSRLRRQYRGALLYCLLYVHFVRSWWISL
jgi:hypothetical protein